MEGYSYIPVAASQVLSALTGSTGKSGDKGDYLHAVIVSVATSATSTVTLTDNTSGMTLVPANTPIGVYAIELNVTSKSGAWKITTAAGVTVIAVGRFS